MSNYHGEIMNIPVDLDQMKYITDDDGEVFAYKVGHRDARHEAAQLGNHADCVIEELRGTLDDVKFHLYTLMNNDNAEFINSVVVGINKALKLGGN